MKPQLSFQRDMLPFTSVLLQCLDERQEPIKKAIASGFIRREQERLFLYTCWHVVTGYDPNDIRVGPAHPERRYLRVALQDANEPHPGMSIVGGLQTCVLPLYDSPTLPLRPRWYQDDQHIPHLALNEIGLHVPFWHDVVKLELPSDVRVSDMQVIDEKRLCASGVGLGDKCMVVGYPYGFSAYGPQQPTAIALTRFVASHRVLGRPRQLLLESIGAPGMSGGPVFIERADDLLFFGIYTGLIYPDYTQNAPEKVTALGTVTDLSSLLSREQMLVSNPSQAGE
jgi:hypothetical protein